jgi:glycogen operon protein
VKNFMTVTLLSLGLPMFLMGDEVRRTQLGNNNAYCQDAAFNWFDWSLLEKHKDVHRFVKLIIARRLLRDAGAERERVTLTELISRGVKGWHGIRLDQPDWGLHSHSFAFSAELPKENALVYFIFNAYWEALDFELPHLPAGRLWRRWVDTFLLSPQDIVPWMDASFVTGQTYQAGPRSVVVLWA